MGQPWDHPEPLPWATTLVVTTSGTEGEGEAWDHPDDWIKCLHRLDVRVEPPAGPRLSGSADWIFAHARAVTWHRHVAANQRAVRGWSAADHARRLQVYVQHHGSILPMKIIVSYIFYTKNALNLVALSVNDVFKFQIMPHAPIYCYKPEKKRKKKKWNKKFKPKASLRKSLF